VIRPSAPAQRRIIHDGEIVEDERRRVNELHGGRRPHGTGRPPAADLGAQQRQDRPDPLGRSMEGVGHRLLHAAAAGRHQPAEFSVDLRVVVGEEGGRRNHRARAPDAGSAFSNTSMY
jgi:hypothetical protein